LNNEFYSLSVKFLVFVNKNYSINLIGPDDNTNCWG
jgi:hypothetical protein